MWPKREVESNCRLDAAAMHPASVPLHNARKIPSIVLPFCGIQPMITKCTSKRYNRLVVPEVPLDEAFPFQLRRGPRQTASFPDVSQRTGSPALIRR